MIESSDALILNGSVVGGCLPLLMNSSDFGPYSRAYGEDKTRGLLLTVSASLQGNIT